MEEKKGGWILLTWRRLQKWFHWSKRSPPDSDEKLLHDNLSRSELELNRVLWWDTHHLISDMKNTADLLYRDRNSPEWYSDMLVYELYVPSNFKRLSLLADYISISERMVGKLLIRKMATFFSNLWIIFEDLKRHNAPLLMQRLDPSSMFRYSLKPLPKARRHKLSWQIHFYVKYYQCY